MVKGLASRGPGFESWLRKLDWMEAKITLEKWNKGSQNGAHQNRYLKELTEKCQLTENNEPRKQYKKKKLRLKYILIL